jgi:serine/threonine protein kinase
MRHSVVLGMRPVSEGNDHRMPTPPETIAQRYEIGPLLGRGGMGEVRAATDLRLGRAVAIKVLRSDLAEQDKLRGRFEREARAAARINHPNVVAIYDIGEEAGVPFIVMERLPGNSLANELTTGRLGQTRACALGLEVLSAIDAAHHLGVIHRDIKPANILLDTESHAKVADFGIAKLAEEDSQTTMGMVFGTASYLAPERLAGHIATPASDLYAVGVLLFEALAGRPPFQGDTPLALVEAISRGESEPLGRIRPDVDPAVVAVVERAMRQDPAERFASASDMRAALAAAGQTTDAASVGEPTVATPIVNADAEPTRVMSTVDPAADRPTVPSRVETGAAARPARVMTRARWLVTAAVVAVLLVAVILATRDSNTGALPKPPSSATSPTGSIPPPLAHAIDDLDKAVRP